MSVAAFGSAMGKFSKLLEELNKEVGARGKVEWMLGDLEFGSAIVTGAPVPKTDLAAGLVPTLVASYLATAEEVRQHPGALTRPALRLVHEITALVSDSDQEAVFETAEGEVVFLPTAPSPTTTPEELPKTFGTVRGRVQTLQQRPGLRFVLYDEFNDKAVTSYLRQGEEERMRDAWGRLAEVTGMVSREPMTGRPISIRDIIDVRVVNDSDPFAFRRARGVLRPAPGAPPAEEVIRRLRDDF